MKKLGLVLEGGGVKGAYEAGILTVLGKAGVKFDGVVGTSIGAVNGALYLQGGCEFLRSVWDKIRFTTLFDIDDEALEKALKREFDKDTVLYFGKQIGSPLELLHRSYDKTESFFKSLVTEEKLRANPADYGLVTFCLSDKKPRELMKEEIPFGELVDYIVASATFPIFPPKTIAGKKFIDGGVYDNLPINLLIRKGYEKILVIRANPAEKKPKRPTLPTNADVYYIIPDKKLGMAMSFTSAKVAKLLADGEKDAEEHFNYRLPEFLDL